VPCQTPLCASNPSFPYKDVNEITGKATEAAFNGSGDLCPRIETRPVSSGQREIVAGKSNRTLATQCFVGEIGFFSSDHPGTAIDPNIDLDIATFKSLIEQCKRDQSYVALLSRLQTVFSSLSRLSMSFADVSHKRKDDPITMGYCSLTDAACLTSYLQLISRPRIQRTHIHCYCPMSSKPTGFCENVLQKPKSKMSSQRLQSVS